MRVQVQLVATGFRAHVHKGASVRFVPGIYTGEGGVSTDMMVTIVDAHPRDWRSSRLAADRGLMLLQGLVDLVLKWPSPAAQATVVLGARTIRARSRNLSDLSMYEVGELLSGPTHPSTVFVVTQDQESRIDRLCTAAFAAPPTLLDSIVGCLAQVSAAAAGTHPYDRVTPLWSGLELLYHANKTDSARIEAITRTDPSFAREEMAYGRATCSRLLKFRAQLANDPWLYRAVRLRLVARPSGAQMRVEAATFMSYAIRSLIVHGQWARARERHRREARAAELWLWQLVEREIELRLIGFRLPAVKTGATAVSR